MASNLNFSFRFLQKKIISFFKIIINTKQSNWARKTETLHNFASHRNEFPLSGERKDRALSKDQKNTSSQLYIFIILELY